MPPAALTVVFLLAATLLAECNNEPFTEAGLAVLCTLSQNQKSLAAEVAAAVTNRATKLEQVQKLKSKLPLMQLETTKYPLAVPVLTTLLTAIETDLSNNLKTFGTSGVKATAANTYAAGRVDEFVALIKQTAHDGTESNTCIKAASGSTITPSKFNGCTTPTFDKEIPGVAATAKAAEQKLPTNAEMKHSSGTSCKITQDDGGGLTGGTNNINLNLLDGFYAHTAGAAWSTPPITTAAKSQTLNKAKTAAAGIQQALTEYPATIPTSEETLAAMISDGALETKMRSSIQQVKQLETEIPAGELENSLTSVFGKKEPNGSRPFTLMLHKLVYEIKSKAAAEQVTFFELTEEQTVQIFQKKLRDLTTAAAKETTLECPSPPNHDADCKGLQTADKCDENPKCSWHKTVKDGEANCKFNATKAEKSGVPETQPQTGGTETTTEKCKGKEQKDCKDGCNWDGKECKDSSFLLNKKFALSVVSAAFVALLF
uniref:Variant surface glycoprotein n=1 Tax=Trypanosoma brucei TaxID=5691 RepID=A0A1V0G0A4_9TRYP|nr:variant surface glycoprotein [Trypanosoma brucei]